MLTGAPAWRVASTTLRVAIRWIRIRLRSRVEEEADSVIHLVYQRLFGNLLDEGTLRQALLAREPNERAFLTP